MSEAVTNAIVHGYFENEKETVYMCLELAGERLTIKVVDTGAGIEDIEKAREPLYSTRDFEERAGLGFTIMDIFPTTHRIIRPGEGRRLCRQNIELRLFEENVGLVEIIVNKMNTVLSAGGLRRLD